MKIARLVPVALAAAIVFAMGPEAQAVVACQKVNKPEKVKLRGTQCKPGTETEVPLTDPIPEMHVTADGGQVDLPNATWTELLSLSMPEGEYAVRASARVASTGDALAVCQLRRGFGVTADVLDASGSRPLDGTQFFSASTDIVLGELVSVGTTGILGAPTPVSLWCFAGTLGGLTRVDSAMLEAFEM